MIRTWWALLVLVLAGCSCRKQPFSYQFVRRDFDYVDSEADKWLCVIFGICAISPEVIEGHDQDSKIRTLFEWSQLEFDYSSDVQRQIDIDSGNFVPGDPAPIDTEVHYSHDRTRKDRVFITIPRFQPGVPVTLGVVTEKKRKNNPIIRPFPNWEWQTNPKQCKEDRIVSVYRIMIDECQRLWILDTGRVEEEQVCLPQILAFDLKTDRLVHRYEIPSDQIESRSILVTPIVDVRDAHRSCKDTFVYVADCQTYSIIVHDVRNGNSWKVTDKTMYPYPDYGTYNILGDSFDLMDGVLGMALSPYRPGEDRVLFYHAMSSPTENWVYTSDLRNRTRFIHNAESSPEIFHTYKNKRRTQSAAEVIDKDGTMYFGLMSDVTLNCWNTHTDYDKRNFGIISDNKRTMQFVSGIKVSTNTKVKQELWFMTSRFQKVAAETLNPQEINFRIQAGLIDDIVHGTGCKSRPGGYGLIQPPGLAPTKRPPIYGA